MVHKSQSPGDREGPPHRERVTNATEHPGQEVREIPHTADTGTPSVGCRACGVLLVNPPSAASRRGG